MANACGVQRHGRLKFEKLSNVGTEDCDDGTPGVQSHSSPRGACRSRGPLVCKATAPRMVHAEAGAPLGPTQSRPTVAHTITHTHVYIYTYSHTHTRTPCRDLCLHKPHTHIYTIHTATYTYSHTRTLGHHVEISVFTSHIHTYTLYTQPHIHTVMHTHVHTHTRTPHIDVCFHEPHTLMTMSPGAAPKWTCTRQA